MTNGCSPKSRLGLAVLVPSGFQVYKSPANPTTHNTKYNLCSHELFPSRLVKANCLQLLLANHLLRLFFQKLTLLPPAYVRTTGGYVFTGVCLFRGGPRSQIFGGGSQVSDFWEGGPRSQIFLGGGPRSQIFFGGGTWSQ